MNIKYKIRTESINKDLPLMTVARWLDGILRILVLTPHANYISALAKVLIRDVLAYNLTLGISEVIRQYNFPFRDIFWRGEKSSGIVIIDKQTKIKNRDSHEVNCKTNYTYFTFITSIHHIAKRMVAYSCIGRHVLTRTRSQAVARIADRTAKNCRGHVT